MKAFTDPHVVYEMVDVLIGTYIKMESNDHYFSFSGRLNGVRESTYLGVNKSLHVHKILTLGTRDWSIWHGGNNAIITVYTLAEAIALKMTGTDIEIPGS